MPFGSGVQSVKNLPTEPYLVTDALWQKTAKPNVASIASSTSASAAIPVSLPKVGIVSYLEVVLNAKLVIATAAQTPGARWPYGLLDNFGLSVNGQSGLQSGVGEDLRVRQDVQYPAFTTKTDVFPGAIGGGSAIAIGTYNMSLSWRLPIATDTVSLAGALYAQSPSTTIAATFTPSGVATMFPTGTAADITLETYEWSVSEKYFVPGYTPDGKGQLVVPSGLAVLHSLTSTDLPISQLGKAPLPLVRGLGNLQRLYMAFWSTPKKRLSAAPTAATTAKIASLAVTYGTNQTPYTWSPASILARTNNQDYGEPLPYDYLVWDNVKWTPTRDAVAYGGLTTLRVIANLGSTVALAGATAHLVQEDVFSSGA